MRTPRSWPELEAAALAAHRSGVPWATFWPTVAEDCRRLQAACPDAHRSLYGRLLALVVAGDEDGQEPPATPEESYGSFQGGRCQRFPTPSVF